VATRADIPAKLAGSLTPRQAGDARARAWAYVFQCWQGKQSAAGVTSTNGDDPERRSDSDEIRAKRSIP
jgi:hypothetical protein